MKILCVMLCLILGGMPVSASPVLSPVVERNNRMPGTPAQHWIDMIQPHTINSFHLPPDIAAIFHRRASLDAIADSTGNREEFMAHHVLEMSRVPLSILQKGLERGHFEGALQMGPVYTKASEHYYDLSMAEADHAVFPATLDLFNLHIAFLPPQLWTFTHLTGLFLGSNHLTYLPESIRHLTRLEQLSIGKNLLTSLPQGLWTLTQLIELRLQDNPLIALPTSCENLTNLAELILSPAQWNDPQTKHVVETLQNKQWMARKQMVRVLLYPGDTIWQKINPPHRPE